MLTVLACVCISGSIVSAPLAEAIPTPAHLDDNYYVENITPSVGETLGCDQGTIDSSLSKDSIVSLDFGAQNTSNNGNYLPKVNTPVTYAQVEAWAEQFAIGYYSCTGTDTSSTLYMGITTNNSGSYVNSTSGQGWATVVGVVQTWINTYAGQVAARGGMDFEPWTGLPNQSPTSARNWITGWSNTTSAGYLNIGSADGCSQTGTGAGPTSDGLACNHSWYQGDEWWVSYGAPPATVYPEIYTSAQALQWGWISDYGYVYKSDAVAFTGPLDEYDLNSGTNTPTVAWNDLYNAVNSHVGTSQSTFAHATEMHNAT